MAWIRKVGDIEELVFASDSRLRSGRAWDCAPKIMTLPRSDALISFAGDTDYAYPLMLQMANAIEFYPASRDRRYDISVARKLALQVFNQMRLGMHDLPAGETHLGDPGVRFIFGGYQWRQKRFRIWVLHYDAAIDGFTFRPAQPWGGGNELKVFAAIGDQTEEAKDRLVRLLRERGKLESDGFDMEPFEVLRDIIRERVDPTIGGPPQVGKVYQYMHSQLFSVWWPNIDGRLHALGRPALDFETFDLPSLDPDAPGLHARRQMMASTHVAMVREADLAGLPEALVEDDEHEERGFDQNE